MALIECNNNGLYCAAADVYIDAWRKVPRTFITHAHSDHARWGSGLYICHPLTAPILKHRLGSDINIQTMEYGEEVVYNGVKFSLHPAGHIIGSAQIRVEYKGEVWVASGDYKLENDLISTPFEPVKCHTFISECTFGMPVFNWEPQQVVFDSINTWWANNKAVGITSVLLAYSLGKAQRIIHNLDKNIGQIFTHGAVENLNEVFRHTGIDIAPTIRVIPELEKSNYKGGMIIAPPSAMGTPWLRKFDPYRIGIASGWMNLRGVRRRKAADRGFVLSDHADWASLIEAVKATGAETVLSTHGYTSVFSRYLNEIGIRSFELHTQYEGEGKEDEKEEKEEGA